MSENQAIIHPPECLKCIHRFIPLQSNKNCQHCVWYDDKPSFKLDVRVTTTKLDYFTAERYPQYASDESKAQKH